MATCKIQSFHCVYTLHVYYNTINQIESVSITHVVLQEIQDVSVLPDTNTSYVHTKRDH